MTEHFYADTGHEHMEDESLSPAQILFGLILVSLGGLWLLDVSGVMSVTWTLVGSVMLILIGVLLIAVARQDSHGGMIFLGIVLSAVVLLGSLASWPSWEGGVGDTQIAPTTVADLESEYSWSVGNQELDLTNLELPAGETEISVRLGTGNMEVVLPEDAHFVVEWSVGLGNADIFDETHTGVSRDGRISSDDVDDADAVIILDVQLGMGNLEVRQ